MTGAGSAPPQLKGHTSNWDWRESSRTDAEAPCGVNRAFIRSVSLLVGAPLSVKGNKAPCPLHEPPGVIGQNTAVAMGCGRGDLICPEFVERMRSLVSHPTLAGLPASNPIPAGEKGLPPGIGQSRRAKEPSAWPSPVCPSRVVYTTAPRERPSCRAMDAGWHGRLRGRISDAAEHQCHPSLPFVGPFHGMDPNGIDP